MAIEGRLPILEVDEIMRMSSGERRDLLDRIRREILDLGRDERVSREQLVRLMDVQEAFQQMAAELEALGGI